MNQIRNLCAFIFIFQSETLEHISPDYLKEKFEGLLGINTNELFDKFIFDKSVDDVINIISNRWGIDKDDNILLVYKFLLFLKKTKISANKMALYFNQFCSFGKIINDDNLKGRVHHILIREVDNLDIENNENFKVLLRNMIIDDILFVH